MYIMSVTRKKKKHHIKKKTITRNKADISKPNKFNITKKKKKHHIKKKTITRNKEDISKPNKFKKYDLVKVYNIYNSGYEIGIIFSLNGGTWQWDNSTRSEKLRDIILENGNLVTIRDYRLELIKHQDTDIDIKQKIKNAKAMQKK